MENSALGIERSMVIGNYVNPSIWEISIYMVYKFVRRGDMYGAHTEACEI